MVSAELKLKALGITLPSMPMPLWAYEMAVQADNLLFLTGRLPMKGREPQFIGKLGKELNAEEGRKAA